MSKITKVIRSYATQPEIDIDAWGNKGIVEPEACLIYDKKRRLIVPSRGMNKKPYTVVTGGYKLWKYDMKMAVEHLFKFFYKPNSGVLVKGRKGRLRMIKHYLFESNELNRPDGKVSGTTLYGVWVEEIWHASLWSPRVALAVADLLDAVGDTPEANEVRRLIGIQHKKIIKAERK